MTEQEIFDVFLDELLQRAVDDFHTTAQYALLAEKLERMHRDCDSMFAADEKSSPKNASPSCWTSPTPGTPPLSKGAARRRDHFKTAGRFAT